MQPTDTAIVAVREDDPHDDDWSDDDERACWQCRGEGWGIVGVDWDALEPGWDMDGDIQQCPCCGGSGDAKDCTYW